MDAASTMVGGSDAAYAVDEDCVGRGGVVCAVPRLTKPWRCFKRLFGDAESEMNDVWEDRWR